MLAVRLSSLNKLQRASYKLQGVLGKKHHQVIYGPMKLGGTKPFRGHSITTWARRRGWGVSTKSTGGHVTKGK